MEKEETNKNIVNLFEDEANEVDLKLLQEQAVTITGEGFKASLTRTQNEQRESSFREIEARLAIISKIFKRMHGDEKSYYIFLNDLIMGGRSIPADPKVWVERYNDFVKFRETAEGKKKLRSLSAIALLLLNQDQSSMNDAQLVYAQYENMFKSILTKGREKKQWSRSVQMAPANFQWKAFYDVFSDSTRESYEQILKSVCSGTGDSGSIAMVLKKGFWGMIRLKTTWSNIKSHWDLIIKSAQRLSNDCEDYPVIIRKEMGTIREYANSDQVKFKNADEQLKIAAISPDRFLFTVEANSRTQYLKLADELESYVMSKMVLLANSKLMGKVESAKRFIEILAEIGSDTPTRGEEEVMKDYARATSNFIADIQLVLSRGKYAKVVRAKRDVKSAKIENNRRRLAIIKENIIKAKESVKKGSAQKDTKTSDGKKEKPVASKKTDDEENDF